MRTWIALVTACISFIFVPVFASVDPNAFTGTATPPPSSSASSPPKCPVLDSPNDPSGPKKFGMVDASQVQTYLDTISCHPNACYDEDVTLTADTSGSITINVQATNKCTKTPEDPKGIDPKKDHRGCSSGETQPQITIHVPAIAYDGKTIQSAQTIGPKTRCDPNVTAGAMSGAKPATGPTTPATGNAAQQALAKLDPITDAGKETMSKALQSPDGLGLSKSEADKLVQDHPAKVYDMLSHLAAGDTAKAQEDYKALGLNPNLKDIKTITPDKVAQSLKETPKTPDNPFKDKINPTGSTFNPNASQSASGQCGVSSSAGNLMYAESKCGATTHNPLSSVQGPYQYLCSTWSDYANRTGNGQYANCAYANDRAISTKVTQAAIDQIYLPQFGSKCSSLGISETSCIYGVHFLGEPNMKRFLDAYAQNPNMSSTALQGILSHGNSVLSSNHSVFFAGGSPRTLQGVMAELSNRMGVSAPYKSYAGGSQYVGVGSSPFYTGSIGGLGVGGGVIRTITGSGMFSVGSPMSYAGLLPQLQSLFGGSSYAPNDYYSNQPYSNSDPYPSRSYYQYQPGSTGGYFGGEGADYGSGGSSYGDGSSDGYYGGNGGDVISSGGGTSNGGGGSGGGSGSVVPPSQGGSGTSLITGAGVIIAQPKTVLLGDSIQVSWATVGMRTDSQCKVLTSAGTIAEGNQGTKIVATTNATRGMMTFTLDCKAASNGKTIRETTSVIVQ